MLYSMVHLGQKTSLFEQLQLTLLWDRADLADEQILSKASEMSLVNERKEFAFKVSLCYCE